MRSLTLMMAAFAATLSAQQPRDDGRWAAVSFLLGNWIGEGGGSGPGQGAGGFSFQPDVQGKVLVRKNYSEYPASKDRPAYRHDDLLIVYQEPGGKRLRAIYFDNEEHIIHYTVEAAADAVRFVSDIVPAAPRYRLTYKKTGSETVDITFEIAPEGKPDAFTAYIHAAARRSRSNP